MEVGAEEGEVGMMVAAVWALRSAGSVGSAVDTTAEGQ